MIFYVAMDGKILELSSSALMYFDLDLKKVKEKETHLGRIIPELNKLIATCRDRVSTGVTQLRDNFDSKFSSINRRHSIHYICLLNYASHKKQ